MKAQAVVWRNFLYGGLVPAMKSENVYDEVEDRIYQNKRENGLQEKLWRKCDMTNAQIAIKKYENIKIEYDKSVLKLEEANKKLTEYNNNLTIEELEASLLGKIPIPGWYSDIKEENNKLLEMLEAAREDLLKIEAPRYTFPILISEEYRKKLEAEGFLVRRIKSEKGGEYFAFKDGKYYHFILDDNFEISIEETSLDSYKLNYATMIKNTFKE